MTDAAKIERRKYFRAWNKAHPEKAKEYQARYWEKKTQLLAEKKAEAEER